MGQQRKYSFNIGIRFWTYRYRKHGEGADVNAQDKEGWTALMTASREGHPEAARLLIEAGADVNAQSNIGDTALMFASEYGHTEIVQLLKEAGAKE